MNEKCTEFNTQELNGSYVVRRLSNGQNIIKRSNFEGKSSVYELSFDSGIKVNILEKEIGFLKLMTCPETVIQYIAYRYGLLPNAYSVSKVNKETDSLELVLYLSSMMRIKGTRKCLLMAQRISENICMISIANKITMKGDYLLKKVTKEERQSKNLAPLSLETMIPMRKDESYSGLLFTKLSAEEQQERIFGRTSKRKISEESYSDLNDYLSRKRVTAVTADTFLKLFLSSMTDTDPKLLNFVFGTTLQVNVPKTGIKQHVWNSRNYLIVPEVYKTIKSTTYFEKYLGKNSVLTKYPENYDKGNKIYSEIKGVLNAELFRQDYAGKIALKGTLKGNFYSKDFDPFLEKSLYNTTDEKETLHYIKFGEIGHTTISFNDPNFEFLNYKKLVAGTAREEIVDLLNAYPRSVWTDYSNKESNRILNSKVANFEFLAKEVVVQTHSLRPISSNDEYNMLLFKGAVQFSKEYIHENSSKPKFLENILLSCAQTLVSVFLLKKFTLGDLGRKSPIRRVSNGRVLEEDPSWLKDFKIKGKVFVFNWDLVKLYAGSNYPMWINTIASSTLEAISSRHAYYVSDKKYEISKSLFTYKDNFCVVQNTSIFYSENNRWAKKDNITDANFLREKIFLESAVSTINVKSRYNARVNEVKSLKTRVTKLRNIGIRAYKLLSEKNLSNARILKINRVITTATFYMEKCLNNTKNSRSRSAVDRNRMRNATEFQAAGIVETRIRELFAVGTEPLAVAVSHGIKERDIKKRKDIEDRYLRSITSFLLTRLQFNCSDIDILDASYMDNKVEAFVALHNSKYNPADYHINMAKVASTDSAYIDSLIKSFTEIFEGVTLRNYPCSISSFDDLYHFLMGASRFSESRKYHKVDESKLVGIFKMDQKNVKSSTVEHLQITLDEYSVLYRRWDNKRIKHNKAMKKYMRSKSNTRKIEKEKEIEENRW